MSRCNRWERRWLRGHVIFDSQEFYDAQTQIVLAGDWHANLDWALHAVRAAHETGARLILHVGDFGYWPRHIRGRRYLTAVNELCELLNMDILVNAGNHEDHDAWFPQQTTYPRIRLLTRVSRARIGGRTFVVMIGAASIDKALRTEGENWFRSEMPTRYDVELASRGERCEVLVTHESPLSGVPSVVMARTLNPLKLTEDVQAYSNEGAARVQELADAVQPLIHVHGHWHTPEKQGFAERGDRRAHEVISLGMDGQRMNLVLLQLTDLSWKPVDVEPLRNLRASPEENFPPPLRS